MSDFVMAQGDTAANFRTTCRDEAGNRVDISGASQIQIVMTPLGGGAPIVDADFSDTPPALNLQTGAPTWGDIGYDWKSDASEVSTPGLYNVRATVTFSGGDKQSFPNEGFELLSIEADSPIVSGRYLTLEEFKLTSRLQGLSFADRDILFAIQACSRALEDIYGAVWQKGASPTEVRYYETSGDEVRLDDLLHANEVALDYAYGDVYGYGYSSGFGFGGGGTYSTVLANPSGPGTGDYILEPRINGLIADGGNGEPFRWLRLRRGGQYRTWPRGPDAIRITGQFGWEAVPAGVKVAATILTSRFVDRMRNSPHGIIAIGLEGAVVRARDIARDPDIEAAMKPARGSRRLIV
jgi:hypothetical protein